MTKELNANQLIVNKKDRKFELEVEEQNPFISYEVHGEHLHLTRAEVPRELQGQGIGSALAQITLEHIKKEGKKIVPECPFIVDFISRNKEYEELILAKEGTIK